MLSRPLAAAKCQSLADAVDLDRGEVVARLEGQEMLWSVPDAVFWLVPSDIE